MSYVITWVEDGKDRWEYVDSAEMLLHLFDKAIGLCGIERTYVFRADVLTLLETRTLIEQTREEVSEQ